ncbi:MAG: hypothetical protein Q8934_19055 [Bacillota bacterium]|nr:hypothetical protein [Bacillota bacterium]
MPTDCSASDCRWLGDELDQTSLSLVEKEVLWLVIRKGEAISPIEVEMYLKLSNKTVKKYFLN